MYDADIARDFLLLQEIQDKGFILIGPRSGAAPGFFHGPLWSYLNFPAFFLGQGDPIAVGWFWVLLSIFQIGTTFWLGKKFLGTTASYLVTLLISVQMVSFTRAFFNPSGALICMPIFLGTLLLFLKTKELKFLLLHAFIGGLIFQFQIAVGAPLLVLSFLLIGTLTLRKRLPAYSPLGFVGFIPPLLSYIAFDLRHNFSLSRAVVLYLSGHHAPAYQSFVAKLTDRAGAMLTSGTFFLPTEWNNFSFWLFLGAALLTIRATLKKDYLSLFFGYFYIGFYVLSLIHQGGWGFYYYFPLFPVAFLFLVAALQSFSRVLMIVVVLVLTVVQLQWQTMTLVFDLSQIGQRQMSWQFHNRIAKVTFEEARNKDFGFFLYSPDIQGYRSKYPVVFQQKLHPDKKVHLYQKLPETFVELAGPPEYDLPWQPDPSGFLQNSLQLKKEPSQSLIFKDGYKLEQFYLSEEETKVSFDQDINNWLHFR